MKSADVAPGFAGGSRCASCGAEIRWQRTPAGHATPINPDGTTHWATCPQARDWRKRHAPVPKPLPPKETP